MKTIKGKLKEHKEVFCMLCGSKRSIVYLRRDKDSILKCLQCGLLFVNPQLSQEELTEYYQGFDPEYILGYKEQIFSRGRKILSMIQRFKKEGELLDVGCGYGFFMNLARKYGWKVLGLELSGAASEYAKRNFGLDVFTGKVTEADLRHKSFDLITLQHTLEHLPEPLNMLITLRGKLKDEGILIIVVPNALSLMARWTKTNWLCLAEKTHLFHYSKDTLKKLLRKSGFSPIITKTFQWDTQELLWALKMLIKRQKKIREELEQRKEENSPYHLEEKASLYKKIICRIVSPISWIIEKLGLGAEIIAVAKKRL